MQKLLLVHAKIFYSCGCSLVSKKGRAPSIRFLCLVFIMTMDKKVFHINKKTTDKLSPFIKGCDLSAMSGYESMKGFY